MALYVINRVLNIIICNTIVNDNKNIYELHLFVFIVFSGSTIINTDSIKCIFIGN